MIELLKKHLEIYSELLERKMKAELEQKRASEMIKEVDLAIRNLEKETVDGFIN